MDAAKPSLARRALAFVVLLVAAIVLFRIALGAVTAVFWLGAAAALVAAAIWALSTVKAARRGRSVQSAPADRLHGTSHEERVEAEKRRIQQQLRDRARG
jgi:threonine/homoserine efflux transporter RhtA